MTVDLMKVNPPEPEPSNWWDRWLKRHYNDRNMVRSASTEAEKVIAFIAMVGILAAYGMGHYALTGEPNAICRLARACPVVQIEPR